MMRRGAPRLRRPRCIWMLATAFFLGACDATEGSQAFSPAAHHVTAGANSIPAEPSGRTTSSLIPDSAPPTDLDIAAERDLQVEQPDETSTHLQRDQADSAVAPDDETAERQTGDGSDGDRSLAPTGGDTAVLPPVTFPEASVRDPEAEAADLERRRSVIGLFERLRVAVEHQAGYDREALFDGWLYSGGLSTRELVLRQEQRGDGTWLSVYDAAVVTEAAELDIDHLVPLAEAWESGGHLWTEATWTRFANDLGDPRSLIAVSASTNRAKRSRDPGEWWPPSSSYRCQYAVDWIAVKSRWNLSVDAAERDALEEQIDQCAPSQFDFDPPQPAAGPRE